MVRRGFTVLLAALGAACAGFAGFGGAPSANQLVLLLGASSCAAALVVLQGADSADLWVPRGATKKLRTGIHRNPP